MSGDGGLKQQTSRSVMKLFESDVDATPSSIAVDGQLALTDRLFAALDAIRIDRPRGDWITEVLGFTRFAENGGSGGGRFNRWRAARPW
jgi:hypothetical protein